jgi:hypothetical protein
MHHAVSLGLRATRVNVANALKRLETRTENALVQFDGAIRAAVEDEVRGGTLNRHGVSFCESRAPH